METIHADLEARRVETQREALGRELPAASSGRPRSFASGVRCGVDGTPTCFIHGGRLDGAWDAEALALAAKT